MSAAAIIPQGDAERLFRAARKAGCQRVTVRKEGAKVEFLFDFSDSPALPCRDGRKAVRLD